MGRRRGEARPLGDGGAPRRRVHEPGAAGAAESSNVPTPRLDDANECLWLDGRRVDLTPKAYRVLLRLVEQPQAIVTKAQLLDAAWADAHVGDAVLAVTINQLRDALGDRAKTPRFIETVHRRGYRLIGTIERGASAVLPPSAPPVQTDADGTLVGRAQPLAELLGAFEQARGGQRQVVFVTGDPGIGKTTLVDALAAAARNAGARVTRGQCVDAFGVVEAYMPVLEALEILCRDARHADAREALRSHAPTWFLEIPGILQPGEAEEMRRTVGVANPERMIRELVSATERMTRDVPLVIVLEDLHWADHATVGLLAALAQRREPARLMIVATYRPVDAIAQLHPVATLKPELVARRQAREILLDGLDGVAVRDLVARRFPAHALPDALLEQLAAQTAGNPLFLGMALDELLQRGWLRAQDDVWRLDADLALVASAVPEGVRDIIATRVERLVPETRQLIDAASAAGVSFAVQALAAALERDEADVEAACDALVRASEVLERGAPVAWPDGTVGATYVFHHALWQSILYSRIPPARRRVLHHRIGARLERAWSGSRADEIGGLLAFHFEAGGDPVRSIEYRLRAARVGRTRGANHESVEHLQRGVAALELVPEGPARDELDLKLQASMLTPVIVLAGASAPELAVIAARIHGLAARMPSSTTLRDALVTLSSLHLATAELVRAEAAAERVLASCAGLSDEGRGVAVGMGLVGLCRLMRGRIGDGLAALARGVDVPDMLTAPDADPRVITASNEGFALILAGRPLAGRTTVVEAYRRAETSPHPTRLLYTAGNALRSGVLLDDVELVERTAREIRAVADRVGAERWRGLAELGDGWARAMTGDDRGIDDMRRGAEALHANGSGLNRPLYLGSLARLLLARGRCGDAEPLLDEIGALLDRTDERWFEPELCRLRGAASGDDAGNAEGWYRRGIVLAREQGSRWWELRCATSLGALLCEQGRHDEVRATVNETLAGFHEGFELPDLRAAGQLIDGAAASTPGSAPRSRPSGRTRRR